MSGFLFLLVVDWLMRKATKSNNTGIRWKMTSKLEDLDFADDLALISSTFQHIADKTNRLNTYAKQVGLVINVKKTKLLRINNKDHRDLSIGGQAIENVEDFTCLGARVSIAGGGDEDIHERLRKAGEAFCRLSRSWNSAVYSTTTKVRLFNLLVKSVLLHGCETWKMTEGNKKTLDTFQTNACEESIVFWPYIVSNRELLSRSNGREMLTYDPILLTY